MSELLQGVLLLEHLLCALSGGLNTAYFGVLQAPRPARRVAARVLATVSLAVCLRGAVGVLGQASADPSTPQPTRCWPPTWWCRR